MSIGAENMTIKPISTQQAIAMLAEAFMVPTESVSLNTRREDLPGWDSMGALVLIAELDERFGVLLSAEESRKLHSIGDAVHFMERNGIVSR
jgi:acyl carrier protein